MNKDPNSGSPPAPVLRPPWLQLARAVWIVLAAAAFILAAIGILKTYREPLVSCAPAEPVCAPWMVSLEDITLAEREGLPAQAILLMIFIALIFPKLAFGLVGLLIFWRRSKDWVAMVFALMLALFAVEGITNLEGLQPAVDFLYALAGLTFGLLPFIFPNGRFVPGRIAWAAVLSTVLSSGLSFVPTLGIPVSEAVYSVLLTAPWVLWFFLAVYSVVYRYRFVSSPAERQQTKWAIFGLLASVVLLIPLTVMSIYFPPSQPSVGRLAFVFLVHYPLYFLSYLAIPAGIAFAILRYRLWDIDVIIRRTLQYTLLTGLLALIYFGGVIVLQGVLGPLTGDRNSPLVTVLTTLGIAALFSPLRTRVQQLIDRRFYRKKYDAERSLARFAEAARDEVDMDNLSGALLGVVSETMQPVQASLWLGDRKRAG